MSKYSNYQKAVKLTPTVSAFYYRLISEIPALSGLTGAQMSAVASLMYSQKLYGFDEACQEFDLI